MIVVDAQPPEPNCNRYIVVPVIASRTRSVSAPLLWRADLHPGSSHVISFCRQELCFDAHERSHNESPSPSGVAPSFRTASRHGAIGVLVMVKAS